MLSLISCVSIAILASILKTKSKKEILRLSLISLPEAMK